MYFRNLLFSVFCLRLFSSASGDQIPIQPESLASSPDFVPSKHAKPSLADLLTIEREASIFFTYARETDISSKFTDENSRLTVFAPRDKAVMALAKKPHEGPDSGSKLSQQEYDKRTKRIVESWISAHLVPEYPLSFESDTHKTLLEGKSIVSVKQSGSGPDWENVLLEKNIKITKKKEGSNGDLYIIDGVISID